MMGFEDIMVSPATAVNWRSIYRTHGEARAPCERRRLRTCDTAKRTIDHAFVEQAAS